jgi:glycosyltransferase involved in cell wall biosynthesis
MSPRGVTAAAKTADEQHIVMDARLLGSGGIGTYIAELLPRVIEALPMVRFTVLGDPQALHAILPASRRLTVRRFDPPIYTVREQLEFARAIPSTATLFWAPHYNIPLAWRGPLAVTVHDVAHLALRQPSVARRLYARWMFAAVRRRAAIVFSVSEWTAREVERLVGVPRQLVVIPNGVSPRWLQRDARHPAPEPATPYFLFVGSVKPHKNINRLLDAFSDIASELPHRLVIAGRADGMRTVDHRAVERAAAVGGRVEYAGAVSSTELDRLVRGCDALVLPSIHEGFGLPPLEALAAGRAVAVSGLPALEEVCGPMAEYFDPLDVSSIAEALKRVARRVPDTEEIMECRRAWARRFDWDAAARATSDGLVGALAH